MEDFVKLVIQVRTRAPGSACFQKLMVAREFWEELTPVEREEFIRSRAQKDLTIYFSADDATPTKL